MELTLVSHPVRRIEFGAEALGRLIARLGTREWDALYCPDGLRSVGEVLAHGLDVPVTPLTTPRLSGLVAHHPGQDVLVVCAPEVARSEVADLLDVPAPGVPLPTVGALTRIRWSRTGIRSLICLNDSLHLVSVAGDGNGRTNERRSVVHD